MLTITVPKNELYDSRTNRFIYTKETTLKLEHSLVSISKWESHWHKAFLKKGNKTNEEVIDYIKCMTITQNVDPNVYRSFTQDNMKDIQDYISDPMTATVIHEMASSKEGPISSETPTSELIYYWMIQFGVPSKYEKWHINKLLTLLKVCQIKSQPNKSISQTQLLQRNAEINAMRRAKLGSKG